MFEVQIPTSFFSEKTSEVVREVAAEVVADAPTIFGIGIETATGIALGGGGLAAAVGGWKLLKAVVGKNRKPKSGGVSIADARPVRLKELLQSDGKTSEVSIWQDGVRLAVEGKLPVLGAPIVGKAIEQYVYSRRAKDHGDYLERSN